MCMEVTGTDKNAIPFDENGVITVYKIVRVESNMVMLTPYMQAQVILNQFLHADGEPEFRMESAFPSTCCVNMLYSGAIHVYLNRGNAIYAADRMYHGSGYNFLVLKCTAHKDDLVAYGYDHNYWHETAGFKKVLPFEVLPNTWR